MSATSQARRGRRRSVGERRRTSVTCIWSLYDGRPRREAAAVFADRSDAGRQLAERLAPALTELAGSELDDVVLLALPRGGVPVAAVIGRLLHVPWDVLVVRKLGVPGHNELAMGAIGEGGIRVLNDDVLRRARVIPEQLAAVEEFERGELTRRVVTYRGQRSRLAIADRVAVVVDDGLATGASARAACEVARAAGGRVVVLAVPVAPHGWEDRLGRVADRYVCVRSPRRFRAVGEFYSDFSAVSDAEVVAGLPPI